MGPFFKTLFTDETAFVRFVKALFGATAIVLTGLAPTMPAPYSGVSQAAAGVLAALAVFVPAGDKTPENVKQLANAVDAGKISVIGTGVKQ